MQKWHQDFPFTHMSVEPTLTYRVNQLTVSFAGGYVADGETEVKIRKYEIRFAKVVLFRFRFDYYSTTWHLPAEGDLCTVEPSQ